MIHSGAFSWALPTAVTKREMRRAWRRAGEVVVVKQMGGRRVGGHVAHGTTWTAWRVLKIAAVGVARASAVAHRGRQCDLGHAAHCARRGGGGGRKKKQKQKKQGDNILHGTGRANVLRAGAWRHSGGCGWGGGLRKSCGRRRSEEARGACFSLLGYWVRQVTGA